MAIDIGGMRKPYLGEHQAFEVKDLVSKEPFAQFEHWFEHAKSEKSIEEANAMCVATASKSGMPSARYVLLKVSLCSFLVNQINFNCNQVFYFFKHQIFRLMDLQLKLRKEDLYFILIMKVERAKNLLKILLLP